MGLPGGLCSSNPHRALTRGMCVCVCGVSTVCCLDNYYDDYTTLSSLGEYIGDPSMPLKSEIDKQGACTTLNSPPSNFS